VPARTSAKKVNEVGRRKEARGGEGVGATKPFQLQLLPHIFSTHSVSSPPRACSSRLSSALPSYRPPVLSCPSSRPHVSSPAPSLPLAPAVLLRRDVSPPPPPPPASAAVRAAPLMMVLCTTL